MELTIVNKDGEVMKHFSFITDVPLTDENIEDMISYGRSRWKIESAPQAHRKEVCSMD